MLRGAANEQERALRATADAHERRFSALTERSPVPTLLSEQGMRLAHVNDALCGLVGRGGAPLLGTRGVVTVHTQPPGPPRAHRGRPGSRTRAGGGRPSPPLGAAGGAAVPS